MKRQKIEVDVNSQALKYIYIKGKRGPPLETWRSATTWERKEIN